MRFEWDKEKKATNIRKHRIDFTDIPPIFNGPMLVELDEREDYGEERWIGIGFLRNIVAVVVFVELRQDTIRIISARKANKHERKNMNEHSKTDWQKLATMPDEEIDYTDIPPLDDHFFDSATLRVPDQPEVVVTMQVDPDVFAWFNAQEGGWEKRIRSAMRIYAEVHKEQELSRTG